MIRDQDVDPPPAQRAQDGGIYIAGMFNSNLEDIAGIWGCSKIDSLDSPTGDDLDRYGNFKSWSYSPRASSSAASFSVFSLSMPV